MNFTSSVALGARSLITEASDAFAIVDGPGLTSLSPIREQLAEPDAAPQEDAVQRPDMTAGTSNETHAAIIALAQGTMHVGTLT